MKPLILAGAILLSLFTAGLMNCRTINTISRSMDKQISLSQDAAQQGRWESADQALARALDTWESHNVYLHVTLDHNDIDKADLLLSALQQYAAQHDGAHYCADARRLRTQLDHLAETQRLSLQNIL